MDLTTIIIAAAALVVGLLAGSLLTKRLSPAETRRRELEEKVREKEDELKTYQRDVADHFIKTSGMLRDMHRVQREISEQLAAGALLLTSSEVSRQVQASAFAGLSQESTPRILSAVPPQAPKDYAPSVPGGVLSESYGLGDLPHSKSHTAGLSTRAQGNTEIDLEREEDPTLKIS